MAPVVCRHVSCHHGAVLGGLYAGVACQLPGFAAPLDFEILINNVGGVAFAKLHALEHVRATKPMHVHIDVAAAMTGVSRFGEQYPAWTYVYLVVSVAVDVISIRYNKTEGITDFSAFDYLLTETPVREVRKRHDVVALDAMCSRRAFRRSRSSRSLIASTSAVSSWCIVRTFTSLPAMLRRLNRRKRNA